MRMEIRTRFAGAWLVPVVAALGACAHGVRTQVDFKSVENAGGAHYELRAEQSYTVPGPVDHQAPMYPPDMIALHLSHVVVQTKVIVDEKGHVTDARFPADSASNHPAAFDDAVKNAVLTWNYTPFLVRDWEDIEDAEGNVVDSKIVKEEARPFSLDYEFYFDLRDGKPVVASTQAAAR
jgi:hypothetical protein